MHAAVRVKKSHVVDLFSLLVETMSCFVGFSVEWHGKGGVCAVGVCCLVDMGMWVPGFTEHFSDVL